MDLQAASRTSARGQYSCIGKFGFQYRRVDTGKEFGNSTAANEPPLVPGDHSSAAGQPHASPVHINLSQQASLTGRAQEPILSRAVTTGQATIAGRAAISSPVITTQAPTVVRDEADSAILSISSDSAGTEEGGSSWEKNLTKTHPASMGAEVEQRKKISAGEKTDIDPSLAQDSDVYHQFLRDREGPSFVPDSSAVIQDLQERIDRLRPTIELYQRELQEWDQVTEEKRLGVEDAKKTFESERDVDFSQLHCEDVETLKSYLTDEQTRILEQPLLIKPLLVQEKLDAIGSKLDAGLRRIQDRCHEVHASLKLSSNLDASTVEDTPRTLFTALKQHC